jgi:hypothetical protein
VNLTKAEKYLSWTLSSIFPAAKARVPLWNNG